MMLCSDSTAVERSMRLLRRFVMLLKCCKRLVEELLWIFVVRGGSSLCAAPDLDFRSRDDIATGHAISNCWKAQPMGVLNQGTCALEDEILRGVD